MARTEGRSHFAIIITLGMLIGLNPFSIDMYLPGFAAIAADLGTDTATVGLTLSTFFAGICIGQIIYGPLLDRFGRKRPLLIGLGIFFLTSIAGAFASSIEQLVVLRFIQALGGCSGMVASRAYVRDLFPPEENARIFSLLILVMGVAPIIAPSIGSFIVTALDWHAIFVALAVIAAVIFTAVSLVLPESKESDASVSLNPPKVVKEYFSVALNARFMLFTLAMSFSTAALFVYITSSPILFMKVHQLTEFQFGLTFSFCAFCLIVGSQLNRVLLRSLTSNRVAEITGVAIVMVAALLLVLTAYAAAGFAVTIACIAAFLFLMGMFNPNVGALAITSVHEKIGMASALMGFIQMGLSAIAAAIVSSFASVSAMTMTAVLLSCVGVAVASVFAVRFVRGESLDPVAEMIHTTI